MKVIIVTSPGFRDRELLYKKCDYYLSKEMHNSIIYKDEIEEGSIVHAYIRERGFSIIVADTQFQHEDLTDQYRDWIGRADGIIAFWDGEDNNLLNLITLARELKIKGRVIKY